MPLPTAKDAVTGVPVSRITSGEATHLLPYYTANALSADGRFLCCTRDSGAGAQAWVYDMESGEGRPVSNAEGGVIEESVAFHPQKPHLCYATPRFLYKHDLASGATEELFHTTAQFQIKSEISVGREHVVFWVFELVYPGHGRGGGPIGGIQTMRQCRSFILTAHLETGDITPVWSACGPLTHPVISPLDDNIVLYADQGTQERLQELFTIARKERDNRKPLKLYHASEQRPVYVGHSFFTYDGWVGTQLIEFGGRQPDGSYPDMVGCNAVIKPDGTCDRRARCPGGNKPMHAHAAYADSWWVGDAYPQEGRTDIHMLCIMKNNWETGYCQAEPLAAHGCDHARPFHVHPRLTPDEKMVLFNSNYSGRCHVYAARVEEFLDRWVDRAPFAKRPSRYCYPGKDVCRHPKAGPTA